MLLTESVDRLIDIKEIYLEPEVIKYSRGREILSKYNQAKLIEVPSHWKIDSLHGNEGSIEDWIKIKRNVLVLGVKKALAARPNSRSSHFVAPSQSNGCTMACSYCYVPRRKGFANPISVFVNIEEISKYLFRHAQRQGFKMLADQIDPELWVYEIGENSDCSVDAAISENVKDFVQLYRTIPNAKATFATKFVNRDLLDYDPQGKTRIRFSLMPQSISKIIDVRTSPIIDRIEAVNDFVDAGYEVHLNFSPVVYYEGWEKDYDDLLDMVNDALNEKSKQQLKCEVIFLTHNDRLHEINLGWHPKAEEYLWRPEWQETKFSQTGGKNVRYKRGLKSLLVDTFTNKLKEKLPYCEIRYAF